MLLKSIIKHKHTYTSFLCIYVALIKLCIWIIVEYTVAIYIEKHHIDIINIYIKLKLYFIMGFYMCYQLISSSNQRMYICENYIQSYW